MGPPICIALLILTCRLKNYIFRDYQNLTTFKIFGSPSGGLKAIVSNDTIRDIC